MTVKESFDQNYKKLKKIAAAAVKNHNTEVALQAISAGAQMAYMYNQFYTDKQLEDMLLEISQREIVLKAWNKHQSEYKTVLLYDGFGVDRRGIAIEMCKAICKNGYKLIYVSPLSKKNKQPALENALKPYHADWRFIDKNSSYLKEIHQLKRVFDDSQPDTAFFYTTPNDVAGVVVFNALKDRCFRIQLDLTDHAFWLGLNAFDICSGGRAFSASIQHYFRGISFDRMVHLDASLFVDNCDFMGLPFNEEERFVFSGGALYKTLGDAEYTYYKIVEHILDNHSSIKFLYAGFGDDSQMRMLLQKYPGRVFLIAERPDFYQIMKRCTLYLNTYPMFGGLLMRYAALAGKLPITLKHNQDSDGILIAQNERKIEYDSYDELVQDVDKLLDNEQYRHDREKLLDGAVMTEDCFARNIRLMIEEHRTEFFYKDIKPVDVSKFREEYYERFSYADIARAIATWRNKAMLLFFPGSFIYHFKIVINELLRNFNDTV